MAVAAGGVGRPGRQARGRQVQQTINNVKITVICGFITILVLRGTVGVDLIVGRGGRGGLGSDAAAADAKVVEDIERILREIRSDDGEGGDLGGAPARNCTLGPRVTRWDAMRRRWLAENPGFPPRDARGRPRVLLVSGSPPGPCESPAGDHYLLKSTKNKIDYCRLHGIELVHGMAQLDGGWAKLPLLRRLMLSHPEAEWVWWLDGDALFTDMAFELPLRRYDGRNLVVHGDRRLLLERRSWVAISTSSFLLRNCRWSLELLDAWAPMAVGGGEVLTASLSGRPAFDADDQSALIHLLLAGKERWMEKVYVESEYHLHGFWVGLVGRYEEMMAEHHPGLGDERWPFVTHFVGCKLCGGGAGGGDYPAERCLAGMERAFNFADNQVLRLYGFRHRSLDSAKVRRVAGRRTASPLEAKEAALRMDAKFDP